MKFVEYNKSFRKRNGFYLKNTNGLNIVLLLKIHKIMNYWTIEKYDNRDYVASDVDILSIEPSKNAVIEYNQNEFKDKSSYCSAYWCFAHYSRYTWLEISKEWRKEFIDICLDKKLIIDWVGGYLVEVVDEFVKFISIKTEIDFAFARVDCDDKEINDKFGVITWFRGNTKFKEDRQDDCIIQELEYWDWTWGHCITEYEYLITQDNYTPRQCNIYKVPAYKEFVNSKNHFRNWYFIYRAKINDQLEQDIKDVKEALELWITNNQKNLAKIKAGLYDTDVKIILMIMRSRRV